MSNSTRLQTTFDQDAPADVVALFAEVALDRKAIRAERLALLAELVAEQFGNAGTDAAENGRSAQVAAARHLERAANLARKAADLERARCAADCARPSTRRETGLVPQEPA